MVSSSSLFAFIVLIQHDAEPSGSTESFQSCVPLPSPSRVWTSNCSVTIPEKETSSACFRHRNRFFCVSGAGEPKHELAAAENLSMLCYWAGTGVGDGLAAAGDVITVVAR